MRRCFIFVGTNLCSRSHPKAYIVWSTYDQPTLREFLSFPYFVTSGELLLPVSICVPSTRAFQDPCGKRNHRNTSLVINFLNSKCKMRLFLVFLFTAKIPHTNAYICTLVYVPTVQSRPFVWKRMLSAGCIPEEPKLRAHFWRQFQSQAWIWWLFWPDLGSSFEKPWCFHSFPIFPLF